MEKFTIEEINLICIYNATGTRSGLIAALMDMRGYLASDEGELMELTESVLRKLNAMTDAEFTAVSDTFIPDYDE